MIALSYLLVRTVLFLIADYAWYEKTVAVFLLMSEVFLIMHGVGYFLEIFRVLVKRGGLTVGDTDLPELKSYPPVAVIVSSFREPIAVVEQTLVSFYNLTYPNKQIYFLDDTRYDLPGVDPGEMQDYRQAVDDMCRRMKVSLFRRQWRGAKAGMINDFLDFLEGTPKEGSSMQNYGKEENTGKPEYIVVFDADMNPLPGFIEKLVAVMESNTQMAFVQTPQYYTNFEHNLVARAAGLQQAVFYEYICEGKSLQDAMFCCGTNVIFRREALMDVDGFDESSVTEDFATSLKFHLKGWRSLYLNHVGAFGMGPEDLGSFFKQQFRWALGTVGLLRKILLMFLRHPHALTRVRWWEYILSGTYYFVGFVFLILVLCPMIFLFFDVPTFFSRPGIYALFFVPYFVLTMGVYGMTLRSRHYRIRDLLLGQLLIAISFPVYIKGSVLGLLGIRGRFEVTGKGGSLILPLRVVWPQILLAALALSAIVWGANRLIYERQIVLAVTVNMFWCLYHFAILSSVFFFRNPATEEANE
ncbi:glycosyltransferase family 2 protein [Verrucomicrobiota bacterium]